LPFSLQHNTRAKFAIVWIMELPQIGSADALI
jgi:hypothetical protein